ncbi:MAG TPA: AzlC family ABC transporter permease [Aggregatilineales bacterium]|nr:AzlC family ABC transporter permease [Aggregatilineales bacterium]
MQTTAAVTTTRAAEFRAGVKDTFPLVVGAIPFGIIFGAVAINSGLSPVEAGAMSAFVFAGSAQFIAANLIAHSVAVPIIIFTTFVVNLRHALYSAALAPYVKHLPQRWLVPLGFSLTDETFAVVVTYFGKADGSPYKHWYYLGSSVFMYVNWQVCTWIGITAGKIIPANLGLDFAAIVTFIGIVVLSIRERAAIAAVLVAGLFAVLAKPLPNGLGLIVAALCGVAAGVVAEAWLKEARLPQGGERSHE